jgi:RNA polymerase sigma factor (sigma-70 family)
MRDAQVTQRVAGLLPALSVRLVQWGWREDLVSDAAQELMLHILNRETLQQKLGSMMDAEAASYLFVALLNRTRDLARRSRRSIEVALELSERADEDHPEEELEAWQSLEAAIHSLPEPYREVLDLFILQRNDAETIGRALNRKAATVYQQIHRGKEKLRAIWPSGKGSDR